MAADGMPPAHELLFATFKVSQQAFLRTKLSFALVNLKPIVPGHVLVCPQRVVPRLSELRPDEVSDLFLTVQRVANVVERAYGGESCTVSCQDGAAAGQSVPHVHVHVLPRRFTDFGGVNDEVYDHLEDSEQRLGRALQDGAGGGGGGRRPAKLTMDADAERLPRSAEEMHREAQWLAKFSEQDLERPA